jgi:hypothetical protein
MSVLQIFDNGFGSEEGTHSGEQIRISDYPGDGVSFEIRPDIPGEPNEDYSIIIDYKEVDKLISYLKSIKKINKKINTKRR